MDVTSEHDDVLSNSDGDQLEDMELELSRLASTNLTSRWSHGHSITLFNVERRPLDGKKSVDAPQLSDYPVLRLTWDNFQLARQVRASQSFVVRFASFSLPFPVVDLLYLRLVGVRISCRLLQHAGIATKSFAPNFRPFARESAISSVD